jgi:hypothetical protein
MWNVEIKFRRGIKKINRVGRSNRGEGSGVPFGVDLGRFGTARIFDSGAVDRSLSGGQVRQLNNEREKGRVVKVAWPLSCFLLLLNILLTAFQMRLYPYIFIWTSSRPYPFRRTS